MIFPIRNDQDHERALDRARELWSAPGGSPEADELEVIGTLIDVYERRRWPVEMADPIDFLRFYLEQNGLRQKDLAAIIGGESRASEILNRRRRLTVDMIRAIARAWHIPADLLLGDPVPQLTASESA